ncbi:MAG: hypothetical protein K8T90_14765 [Planctomycetes bacterium]|nr:hypothetical protein [Planctomycetota bacterium]
MPKEPKDQARRDKLADARGMKTVDTFKVSHRGFQRVFAKHFGAENPEVEAASYHLAKIEAALPSMREAIRLARYPKAGDRNPRRMALGLIENLTVLQSNLRKANEALELLATGKVRESSGEEE